MTSPTAGRESPPIHGFSTLPDLASRALGGAVVWANDEFFADKENLIKPDPPVFTPATFTHKGQQYDGWETRRRRPDRAGAAGPAHDSAVIRLGAAGIIRGAVVDTAYFLGNFPPHCSVEAAWCDGYPDPDELGRADWTVIVPEYPLRGGAVHHIDVPGARRRFSHVRLNMLPDGGIARLRVHGEPVPDPAFLNGLTVNLAAIRDGARATGCSDMFYNRPDRMLMPGLAANMGDGWENARRRDGANDWVELALLGEGAISHFELDTTHFKGNAPDQARVLAARVESGRTPRGDDWFELLPRTTLQPDTSHRFLIRDPRPVTHLHLDVFPDGGVARFRAWGTLTPEAFAELRRSWQQTR